MKSPQLPKAKQLVEVAQNSIGLTEGLVMAKFKSASIYSTGLGELLPVNGYHLAELYYKLLKR